MNKIYQEVTNRGNLIKQQTTGMLKARETVTINEIVTKNLKKI